MKTTPTPTLTLTLEVQAALNRALEAFEAHKYYVAKLPEQKEQLKADEAFLEQALPSIQELVRRAGEAAPVASGWMPMADAPKDKTLIIGMESNGDVSRIVWDNEDGLYADEWWNFDQVCPASPTHWIPLPQPPKKD